MSGLRCSRGRSSRSGSLKLGRRCDSLGYAQLPPALAQLLREKGHEAEHVAELGMQDGDDSPIWDYALKMSAIVVTKDEDFPHRQSQGRKQVPVVVWLRIGNASRRALLNWFELLLPQIEA